MATKNLKAKDTKTDKSVIARSDDGTIQITFTIPWKEIEAKQSEAAASLAQDIEVPGFRRGKAPLDAAKTKIPEDKLLQETLSKILPKLISEAITEYKIRPIIYPRFELVSAIENEDWQVRATTCEVPNIDLGDYKAVAKAAIAEDKIWIPGKDEKAKKLSNTEKEQKVIDALLQSIKIVVPQILIDEEANSRLSALLSKLEKLGLNLDSYLASIGKTPQEIRSEYSEQAKNALALEFLLSRIAEMENINPTDSDIEAALKTAKVSANDSPAGNADQKRVIAEILKRRMVLDNLISGV